MKTINVIADLAKWFDVFYKNIETEFAKEEKTILSKSWQSGIDSDGKDTMKIFVSTIVIKYQQKETIGILCLTGRGYDTESSLNDLENYIHQDVDLTEEFVPSSAILN